MVGVRLVLVLFLAVLGFLILLPTAFLIIASFTSTRIGSPLGGELTLVNYVEVFSDPSYYQMILNSLVVGVGSTVLAVGLGTALAWIVARTNTPLTHIIEGLIVAPIIISPFVGAIAWTILLSPRAGLINLTLQRLFGLSEAPFNIYSFGGLIWVLGIYLTPYIFIFVSSSLRSMDPALEESSFVLGAGNILTALRVTLPLSLPSIVSGAILVFVLSMEMFSVPALIGVPAGIYVMTTQVYNYLRYFPPRYGAATVTGILLLATTVICIYLQRRVVMRKQYVTITGRAFRPRLIELGRSRYLTLAFCLTYIFLVAVLPIGAIIFNSFLPYFSPHLSLASLTLKNYVFAFLSYPKTVTAIRNTLFLSALGATICIFFCLAISYIVHRTRSSGRGLLDYVSTMPIAFPAIVLAVALLWVWVSIPIGIYGTIWVLLIAYITRYIPWGTRAASSTLLQIHSELEECSKVLGASTLQTIRRVVIPLSKLGLLSGWVLLFTLFAKELSASILLYSPGSEVLSVVMYDLWENGQYGPVCALTVAELVIVVFPIYILRKLGGKLSFV